MSPAVPGRSPFRAFQPGDRVVIIYAGEAEASGAAHRGMALAVGIVPVADDVIVDAEQRRPVEDHRHPPETIIEAEDGAVGMSEPSMLIVYTKLITTILYLQFVAA